MTEEASTGDPGRQAVVAAARALDLQGLNHGSSGNVSLRQGKFMLVTPSGVPSAELTAQAVASMMTSCAR